MNKPILELQGLTRTFHQGGRSLQILKGIDLVVMPGEMVALVGASGSGKSTLLHLAGLLELPNAGQVKISGEAMAHASDDTRTAMRSRAIGFVYQFHHLMPEFTALENVMIPQMIAGISESLAQKHALDLLARIGLKDRITHRPAQLSGGEQQRVAIVRAIANRPQLLLADEPTGNLDEETSANVFNELIALVKEQGLAALIVTHDKSLAQRMDRAYILHQGVLVSEIV